MHTPIFVTIKFFYTFSMKLSSSQKKFFKKLQSISHKNPSITQFSNIFIVTATHAEKIVSFWKCSTHVFLFFFFKNLFYC